MLVRNRHNPPVVLYEAADARGLVLSFPMTFLAVAATIPSHLTPCTYAELDVATDGFNLTTICTHG